MYSRIMISMSCPHHRCILEQEIQKSLLYHFYMQNVVKDFKRNQSHIYNFMSLFCAPILSLFLIGVLTKYACFKGWIVGLIFSLIITIYLKKCAVINVIYLFTSSFLVCTFISLLFSYLLFRKK